MAGFLTFFQRPHFQRPQGVPVGNYGDQQSGATSENPYGGIDRPKRTIIDDFRRWFRTTTQVGEEIELSDRSKNVDLDDWVIVDKTDGLDLDEWTMIDTPNVKKLASRVIKTHACVPNANQAMRDHEESLRQKSQIAVVQDVPKEGSLKEAFIEALITHKKFYITDFIIDGFFSEKQKEYETSDKAYVKSSNAFRDFLKTNGLELGLSSDAFKKALETPKAKTLLESEEGKKLANAVHQSEEALSTTEKAVVEAWLSEIFRRNGK